MFVDGRTIGYLWPEIMLLVVASWIYLVGAFHQQRVWWTFFSIAAYGCVAAVIVVVEGQRHWYRVGFGEGMFLNGPIVLDYFGFCGRLVFLALGVLYTLTMVRGAERSAGPAAEARRRDLTSESLGTLMLLIVGLMLVARANDLVLLFVALELVSIPTYVLLYLGRRDRDTIEAAIKYFFLSMVGSSLFLYGVAFLYGVTGTTSMMEAAQWLAGAANPNSPAEAFAWRELGPLALVLIVAGLGFKLAAVPFHFYAPDVYQGASNANAGLLATAPKIAGMLALVRLLLVVMPEVATAGWQLTMVLAVFSMTLGNVCALWQRNVRRLMAYSSIAHAGYMLIGLCVGLAAVGHAEPFGGVAATLLYLVVYVFASLGVFAVLAAFSDADRDLDSVDGLAGLGRGRPLLAGTMALLLFSLAGIPPLAGFWGKFSLFSSALRAAGGGLGPYADWFVWLAVAGAVNAAIAAAYYLRVIAVMYFRPAAESWRPARAAPAAAAILCAAVVLGAGLFPRPLLRSVRAAELNVHRQGGPRSATVQALSRSAPRTEKSPPQAAPSQDGD